MLLEGELVQPMHLVAAPGYAPRQLMDARACMARVHWTNALHCTASSSLVAARASEASLHVRSFNKLHQHQPLYAAVANLDNGHLATPPRPSVRTCAQTGWHVGV
jgi:hypothetical protein